MCEAHEVGNASAPGGQVVFEFRPVGVDEYETVIARGCVVVEYIREIEVAVEYAFGVKGGYEPCKPFGYIGRRVGIVCKQTHERPAFRHFTHEVALFKYVSEGNVNHSYRARGAKSELLYPYATLIGFSRFGATGGTVGYPLKDVGALVALRNPHLAPLRSGNCLQGVSSGIDLMAYCSEGVGNPGYG